MKKVYLILSILLVLCPWSVSQATETTLGDCARTTVANAITAAATDDVIICPADTQTWATPVTINKRIELRGNGLANTIINSTGMAISASGTTSFIVDGFKFVGNGTSGQTNGFIAVGTTGTGWRIHHNEFVNAYGRSILVDTSAYGLIDHNIFTAATGWQQGITLIGGLFPARAESFMAYMGTINATYIEDNTWNWNDRMDGAIDTGGAARLVFRYNTVNGTHFNVHGTYSGYRVGPQYMEVYNNTFTGKMVGSTGNAPMRVFNIRGGTGVFFNNVASGTWTFGAGGLFANDRDTVTGSWGGLCDGTDWKVNNPTGAAVLSTTGTYGFCSTTKDQYCTTDGECPGVETCTAFFDGDAADGYPCQAQVGTGPNQTSEPFYAWSNTGMTTISSSSSHIVLDRDFKLSARPGYAAYTYPHPLQGTAPAISEVTPVATPSSDITPTYVFTTDQAGTVTYGGSCGNGDLATAVVGENSTTYNVSSTPGTYSNCTIKVTNGYLQSTPLTLTSFTITGPAVALTAPPAGNQSGTVTLTATCTHADGCAGVTFYYGTTMIGAEDTASPYTVSWDTVALNIPDANYSLKAVGRANGGATTESSPVSVTVTNPHGFGANRVLNYTMLGYTVSAGSAVPEVTWQGAATLWQGGAVTW